MAGSPDREDLRGQHTRVRRSGLAESRPSRRERPGGICTVDNSASSPFSADESMGTPITGSGRVRGDDAGQVRRGARADDEDLDAAARRLAHEAHARARAIGARRRRSSRTGSPCSRRTSTAPCMTGASESEPIENRGRWICVSCVRICSAFRPMSRRIVHALERDLRDACIRPRTSRRGSVVPSPTTVEHATAGADDVAPG